MKIVL